MAVRTRLTRRGKLALALLPSGFAMGLLTGAGAAASDPLLTASVAAPPPGAVVNAAALNDLRLELVGGSLGEAVVTLDGQDVTEQAAGDDGSLHLDLSGLPDGDHELMLRVPRTLPAPDAVRRWSFRVDASPPVVSVTSPRPGTVGDGPLTVGGSLGEDAVLAADGNPVTLTDRRFAFSHEPRSAPLQLVATDTAGNTATVEVPLVTVPSRVRADEVRAVHMSFFGWVVDGLRGPVLEMAERGEITSVQLDLKDESGQVGYATDVPLARRSGAARDLFELDEVVGALHERDVHVVGRIVAFRDPVLAQHAWSHGERDLVLQTAEGAAHPAYGGFTNPASPVVHDYLVDLAVEAAAAGVDDIVYDYVRRPEGLVSRMSFPGLDGPVTEAIVAFLASSRQRLAPYGVEQGASVYGTTTRGPEVGQDVGAIAGQVDYVAPMVYPSHWGPGDYGLADPERAPYEIVRRSLADFEEAVAGTGARVVPWLQDFSLGVPYGPQEVQAQISAAADIGIREWLMWNPKVTYHPEAFAPPGPLTPPAGSVRPG